MRLPKTKTPVEEYEDIYYPKPRDKQTEMIEALSYQVSLLQTNYDSLFKYFNDRFPDEMQKYLGLMIDEL